MKEYPAIFEKAEDGGYYVHFPDLAIRTEGDTLEEAKLMAGDLLYCWLFDADEDPYRIPEVLDPSTVEEIQAKTDDLVFLIKPEIYVSNYARQSIIEREMEKKDFSLEDLAKKLNITEKNLLDIINSKEKPSIEVAKKMGDMFDFDYEVLFFGKKYLDKK